MIRKIVNKSFIKKVLIFLGACVTILIIFSAIRIYNHLIDDNVSGTKIKMLYLRDKIYDFYRDCLFIPTTDQGLKYIAQKQYYKRCKKHSQDGYISDYQLLDDWDNRFGYVSYGGKFVISTTGQVHLKIQGDITKINRDSN